MPRGSPASRCRSRPHVGVAAPERQPQPRRARSPCAPPRRRARASTPASSSWCARRRRASRRSSGWPTGTRSGSRRSRCWSALVAYLLTRDPIRVLAVLVVATPCPLILATPVAIVGGINRAARRGIIFRHGTALEQLARSHRGRLRQDRHADDRPAARSRGCSPRRRSRRRSVLRLAGGGRAWLRPPARAHAGRGGGRAAESALPQAREITEAPGEGRDRRGGGPLGDGGRLGVRGRPPSRGRGRPPRRSAASRGAGLRAYVAVDGRGAGVVEYADRLRPEMRRASSPRSGGSASAAPSCSRATTRPTPPRSAARSASTRRTATCCRTRRWRSSSGW